MEAFPASWTVRRALEAYLAENGFTFEAYEAKWTDASFLGVRFAVPNTRKHRWAIMLHDLHHVATGFGTDLAGEGEISAWELRGLRSLGLYVASIVLGGVAIGFARAPLRAWSALRSPGRTLFDDTIAYAQLLDMTVGELRAHLGLPEQGLARGPRALHAYAPQSVATAARSSRRSRRDAPASPTRARAV